MISKKLTPQLLFLFTFILGSILVTRQSAHSLPPTSGGQIPPAWTYSLPAKTCVAAILGQNCQLSSPVLADLTNDGVQDIVIGTNNGHLVAINYTTQTVIWDRDIATAFGLPAGSQEISSSPAIGDIDGDGNLDVVVGVGTIYNSVCTQGGIIAYDRFGNVKPGWPFLAQDYEVPPAGCRDSIFSTPALGDLNKDGRLEIVAGGFDKKLYVLQDNGTLLPGFPIDSYLYPRLGWQVLQGRLADTIWSSPALGDVDGDGYLDIVIGSDEGNFDHTYPGDSGGWVCPYQTPTPGYCGGALYVVNRFGQHLPGFPIHLLEHIQSSPALYDVEGDGKLEIFVGTGTYYHNVSPDHPTSGFRIHAWNSQGNVLPGWAGGVTTGGSMPSSPVLGNIVGDAQPEVLALSMDHNLYAWHLNGTPVTGFPTTPLVENGTSQEYNYSLNPVLADYTSDDGGKMEIFLSEGWGVTIMDGDGSQITTSNFPSDNKPFYYLYGVMQNTPAVGDIDGDGELELVANNSTLYIWDLPTGASLVYWPMFRGSETRDGHLQLPRLNNVTDGITVMVADDGPNTVYSAFVLQNGSHIPFNWSAAASHADVTVVPANGVVVESAVLTVSIATNGRGVGTYSLGNITVNGTINGEPIIDSPHTLPVTLIVVDVLHQVHLPIVKR